MNLNELFRQLDSIVVVNDARVDEAMQTGYIRRMQEKRRRMKRLDAREIKERLRQGACIA